MEAKLITLPFPLLGLNKRLSYQQQPPHTTADCLNVFPDDAIKGRERGGSRPAIAKAFAQELGGGEPVRGQTTVRFHDGTDLRTMHVAVSNGQLWRDATAGTMSQLSTSLTLNSAVPLQMVEFEGKVYIADYGDRVVSGTDGVRGTTATTFDAASVSDWTAEGIDVDDMVLVIYDSTDNTEVINGTYVISSLATGEITLATACNDGAGTATASWYIARCPKIFDPVAGTLTRWVATADKGEVPTGCPLVTNWRGRLVLAGEARAPHVWYMSRQLDPLDWDYSPAESYDRGKAVAGNSAEAGGIGEPILALIDHSDQCLLFGCSNSMWILRGDQASGGELDRLSHTEGIVGGNAFCYTADGYLFFLALDGLYAMAPGCGSPPRSISREKLPEELLNIGSSTTVSMAYDHRHRALLLFLTQTTQQTHWMIDVKQAMTGDSGASASFWPVKFQLDHEAFSLHARRAVASAYSTVMIGGRDGYLRRFEYDDSRDDGDWAIDSYVLLGPIDLTQSAGYAAGIVNELTGTPGRTSGQVYWELQTGDTAENAVLASSVARGVWRRPGRSHTSRPRRRGGAACIKISGEGGQPWALETVQMAVLPAGKAR